MRVHLLVTVLYISCVCQSIVAHEPAVKQELCQERQSQDYLPNNIPDLDSSDSILDEMDELGLLIPKQPSRLVNFAQVCGCYCMIRYLECKKMCRTAWHQLLVWMRLRSAKA